MFIAHDIISGAFHSIPSSSSIEAAIERMIRDNLPYLLAVDESGLRALITYQVLLLEMSKSELKYRSLESITNEKCKTIPESANPSQILQIVLNTDQDFYPVTTDKNEVVGVLSLRDLVQLLGHNLELREVYD